MVMAPQERGIPPVGADFYHSVGLLQGERHRFLGEDGLGPGLGSLDRQEGPTLGVGANGHDIQRFLLVHFQGVGIEGLEAVTFPENLQACLIPLGPGHQLHLGTIPQGLGVGTGQPLVARVVMVVKPAMDVHLGGNALGVFHLVGRIPMGALAVRPVPFGDVVEDSRPSQADHPGTILWPRSLLRRGRGRRAQGEAGSGGNAQGQGRSHEVSSNHACPPYVSGRPPAGAMTGISANGLELIV